MDGERGGKACTCTLFSLFWRTEFLIPFCGCGPSPLLRLAVEEGLNYWLFCSSEEQLKKARDPPGHHHLKFSLLPHYP